MERKKRIQIDFTPDAFESLKQFKDQTKTISYTELIRNALRFFRWVFIQIKVEENELILINKKFNKEQIVDPFIGIYSDWL